MPRVPRIGRGRGRGDTPPEATEQPTLVAEAVGTPSAAPEAASAEPGAPAAQASSEPASGSFLDRGKARRRLRYLRRARELAYRDLGGLVFDLHRFGRGREDLVGGKVARLGAIDAELRALERVLADRRDVTILREPGLAACPRCGALHGSDAVYCSSCALPVSASAGLPMGTPAAPAEPAPAAAAAPAAGPAAPADPAAPPPA